MYVHFNGNIVHIFCWALRWDSTDMQQCTLLRMHARTNTHTHTHTHSHTHTHTHTHTHISHTHTHTHTLTHTHLPPPHTHTYTHGQVHTHQLTSTLLLSLCMYMCVNNSTHVSPQPGFYYALYIVTNCTCIRLILESIPISFQCSFLYFFA